MSCSCVLWLFVLTGFGPDEEMLPDGLIKKKTAIKIIEKYQLKSPESGSRTLTCTWKFKADQLEPDPKSKSKWF